tara:strand:+ start:3557 stop:4171 length:615 start_codon:yes stop_codon:yes gene_type:complete
MIEIYGAPGTRAFRIYWLLEELAMPYKMHPVKPGQESHSEDFRKINPNGKVPALKDGDFLLFESAAIAYYICNLAGEQKLLPKEGSKERALNDQWMFWCLSELEQAPWTIAKHTHVYPEELRSEDAKKGPKQDFAKNEKVLAECLQQQKYLIGDEYHMADLFVAQTLNWASHLQLLTNARLKSYVKDMKSLSSFERAKALIQQM